MPNRTLAEGIEALLAQCDKEDANPPGMRYLHTSEIRGLLFGWATADYSALQREIKGE